MSFLELIQSKFKKSKPVKVETSIKKDYVNPNIVYLYTVEVPSKKYKVEICANTKMEALFETMQIMRLTEVPTDVVITCSDIPYDSTYKSRYWFYNTDSYIKPVNYKQYVRYDSRLVNE
jgi:hypothetical protein